MRWEEWRQNSSRGIGFALMTPLAEGGPSARSADFLFLSGYLSLAWI